MVRLFDNTLRDGGNVVGHGFPISLTQSIIGALLEAGIPDIECGNCKGLGAYAKADAKQAPSDEEYFEAVQPYLSIGDTAQVIISSASGGIPNTPRSSEYLPRCIHPPSEISCCCV